MLALRHTISLVFLATATAFVAGCVVVNDDGQGSSGAPASPKPIGTVASTAAEAWPNKGQEPTPLTPEEIVQACEAFTTCGAESGTGGETLLFGLDLCVQAVTWSGERVIPMSNLIFGDNNERAEAFVRCALEKASNCVTIKSCLTARAVDLYCEEDGCRVTSGSPYTVTCVDDVAQMVRDGKTVTRDCAKAFAKCDAASPTGCTDRQFTACAPEDINFAGRCDGNVRLGCDSGHQVSYRDCERLSGVCGALPSGDDGCIYSSGLSLCPKDQHEAASCSGTNLSVCVNGERFILSNAKICGG